MNGSGKKNDEIKRIKKDETKSFNEGSVSLRVIQISLYVFVLAGKVRGKVSKSLYFTFEMLFNNRLTETIQQRERCC